MPTIEEIIAKRNELQKTNPNATNVDARNILSTPVVPTAPVTQTPTVTGVDGQKFTQAPIDPTTGLSTPIPPTTTPAQTTPTIPTTPVAQVTPTPETPKMEVAGITIPTTTPEVNPTAIKPEKNYNVSAGRESEIQKNIQDITATNKTLLQDRNAFNKAFGYDTADAGKKAILDSSFSTLTTPQDVNSIFTALKTGASIANQNTPEYRQAQNRFNTFKKFSTYDVGKLSTALGSGDILVGTQTYNDLVSDPAMYAKMQKAQMYTTGKIDEVSIGNKQGAYVLGNAPTVASAMSDGNMTQDEYNSLTNTKEVNAQAIVVGDKKTAYETLKVKYDAVEDDVDKEFTGKEVTDSFKAKIVADRRKGMYKDYQIASIEYQNALGTYTELKNSSTQLLEINMKQYENQQALKNEQAKLQMEADFKKKQAQEALNDPATAIQSVMDEYKKLGIPFTTTVQSRLEEFKKSGKPLAQYLNDMTANIQASPAYQAYQSKQMGTEWQSTNITRYNPATGANESTPIFYRKKTTGGFEAVDLSGKPIDVSSLTGGATPTSSPTRPTGNIVPVMVGGKTVRLDQSGSSGFESAVNTLTANGTPIVIGEGARNQTATIEAMAKRYGIPFNASNPVETAQKLRSAGHQVADPGKSNHETGMAIDVYANDKLDPVTPDQEKVLNANGWFSAEIPGDAGHFEYRGNGVQSDAGAIDIPAYQKYLNSGTLPTGMKAGTTKANEWLQGYSQWKSTANPVSETIQKRIDSYSDDYSKNPNVVSAFKFAPLLRQYDNVKVSDLSSSQRQGIISDYAKALDPDSVVREGEYATVAKYSSAWGEKTLSEINQFLSGNGTLSDAAAQKVIDAIKSRGKNYIEQEKNIRNQYIEKINRATGNKDGESQLIYPDYSNQTIETIKNKTGISSWSDFTKQLVNALQ